MLCDYLWQKFFMSGNVLDYLIIKETYDEANANDADGEFADAFVPVN